MISFKNNPSESDSPEGKRDATVVRRIIGISAFVVASLAALVAVKMEKENQKQGIGVIETAKGIKRSVESGMEENRKITNPAEAQTIFEKAIRSRYLGGKTRSMRGKELDDWVREKGEAFREEYEKNRLPSGAPMTKRQIQDEPVKMDIPE